MRKLLLLSLFLSACAGTSKYEPLTSDEEPYFNKATRGVSYDEVKKSCSKYLEKYIAWTGVIRDVRFPPPKKNPNEVVMELLVDHHDFDWIKDTYQRENYWLSKETKGKFIVVMVATASDPEKRKIFVEHQKNWFEPENMFIGYGNPHCSKSGEIFFFANYARPIRKGQYSIGFPVKK
jgi:hypothetical protein